MLIYRPIRDWRRLWHSGPDCARQGLDGFELAVRAILGQQVSVAAARKLAHQLVVSNGERVTREFDVDDRLTHVFPEARRIYAARNSYKPPGCRKQDELR